MERINAMDQIRFRNTLLRLVIELVLVIASVSFPVHFPKGVPFAESWGFAFTHPTVLLHIVVGTIALIEAVRLLTGSIRSHRGFWTIWAAAGFVLVLVAFGSGVSFMADQQQIALNAKIVGWLGALIVYAVGWLLNLKKARPQPEISVH